MSQVPHYLTHVSNYSGIFATGQSYEKFDFVYNTGNSRFYYARDNLTYGGGATLSSANRFALIANAPESNGRTGHYIFDEDNAMQQLGAEFKIGQTINIAGSTGTNDGSYKILALEPDYSENPFSPTGTLTGALDATFVGSDVNDPWWRSSWFFNSYPGGGTKGIDNRDFHWDGQDWAAYVEYYHDLEQAYEYYAAGSQPGQTAPYGSYDVYGSNLDTKEWGWEHYHAYGRLPSEGRSVPIASRFIDVPVLDSTYIRTTHETNQEVWFHPPDAYIEADIHFHAAMTRVILGYDTWWWASSGTMGPTAGGSASWTWLGASGSGQAGPVGWVHWQKDKKPTSRTSYNYHIYNSENSKWYRFDNNPESDHGNPHGHSRFSEVEAPNAPPAGPTAEMEALKSAAAPGNTINFGTRLWVQGTSSAHKFDSNEPSSSNTLTLSTLDSDPSVNPDSWSSDLFYFDADYGATVNFKANNDRFKYGNGYYILQPKNINSVNAEFNLEFNNRTNKEANAIIHFLENHQGQHETDRPSQNLKYKQGISGFRWDGNATFHPYDSTENQSKKFLCSEFSHSLSFENSNNLKVKLRNLDTSLLNKSEQLYVNKAPTYSDSSTYQKDDVVFYTGNHQYYYWHSSTSTSSKPPAEPTPTWDAASGYFTDLNTGYWTRDFLWKPSIGLEVSQNPRLVDSNIGGGYTQMYNDGINESMLKLSLQFKNRNDEEAYSLLHFLESHCGCIPFNFSPPAPYERTQNFVCEEWSHQYKYKDSHVISATFEQYPFSFSAGQYTDSIPPPELSSGQLIFTNPLSFAQQEQENLVHTGQHVRARMRFKNVGDSPVDIYSGQISGRIEAADYFLHGQTGNNNIPLISDSLAYDKYVVPIPSVGAPFYLDGKNVRISKNYSDGAIGGHYFTVVDEDGINVIVDGHRDIYFQNNKGEIISGVEAVSTSPTPFSYYVNQPLFTTGNSIDSLAGGEEGYADVIFSGVTAAGITDYLVSGGVHDEDNLEAYVDGVYYNIIIETTDIYYYGDITVYSDDEFSPQGGELRTYITSRG